MSCEDSARLVHRDTDLAIELSKDPAINPDVRAEARANTGLTRWTASLDADPELQLEYRKKSIALLREAWSTRAEHPHNWMWRFMFAVEVNLLLESKIWEYEDWTNAQTEAIDQLTKARAFAPPALRSTLIDKVNQRSFADRR